jgi:hypothetical protein
MDEEQAERYALGEITGGELDSWDEHLLTCEACRVRVQEADVWVHAVQGAASRLRRDPGRARFFTRRMLPAFAAAAALALVLLWVRVPGNGGGPPVAVALAANRGPGGEAHAPAHKPLALQFDLTGLDAPAVYSVEIVDAFGARVWRGELSAQSTPPLNAGVYFVRLYSPDGRLRREYALRVEER